MFMCDNVDCYNVLWCYCHVLNIVEDTCSQQETCKKRADVGIRLECSSISDSSQMELNGGNGISVYLITLGHNLLKVFARVNLISGKIFVLYPISILWGSWYLWMLLPGPSYDRPHQPSQPTSSLSDGEREEEDDDDCEEEEEEEEDTKRRAPREKALKMKPRKLFKEKEKGTVDVWAAAETETCLLGILSVWQANLIIHSVFFYYLFHNSADTFTQSDLLHRQGAHLFDQSVYLYTKNGKTEENKALQLFCKVYFLKLSMLDSFWPCGVTGLFTELYLSSMAKAARAEAKQLRGRRGGWRRGGAGEQHAGKEEEESGQNDEEDLLRCPGWKHRYRWVLTELLFPKCNMYRINAYREAIACYWLFRSLFRIQILCVM